ncbi:MAG: hypothetical protein ACKPKO_64880 [Candidatus Fonsibacter sp.]
MDPNLLRPRQHADASDKWMLVHHWDALLKRLVHIARTNMGIGIASWDVYEELTGTLTSASAAEAAEQPLQYFSPEPTVRSVHPESVVLAESMLEEALSVLTLDPVPIVIKEEIPEEEADVPPSCQGVVWVMPPLIDESDISRDNNLRRLQLKMTIPGGSWSI